MFYTARRWARRVLLSLLLLICVAALAIWVRSYWCYDSVSVSFVRLTHPWDRSVEPFPKIVQKEWWITTRPGGMGVVLFEISDTMGQEILDGRVVHPPLLSYSTGPQQPWGSLSIDRGWAGFYCDGRGNGQVPFWAIATLSAVLPALSLRRYWRRYSGNGFPVGPPKQ